MAGSFFMAEFGSVRFIKKWIEILYQDFLEYIFPFDSLRIKFSFFRSFKNL